jgi:hypothetical protein
MRFIGDLAGESYLLGLLEGLIKKERTSLAEGINLWISSASS